MKEFLTRTLSGLIFIATIIAAVWLSEYTLFILLIGILIPSLTEFYNLGFRLKFHPYKPTGIVAGILILTLTFLNAISLVNIQYLTLLLLITLFIPVFILIYQPSQFFQSFISTLAGLLYIAIPLALINYISFYSGHYDGKFMIAYFAILWTYDSLAYLTGSLLGKTKIFPGISPGKSLEGLIGGTTFAVLAAYILSIFITALNSSQWIILGLIIAITSTIGDLVESAIKRNAKVKDSGKFLPGHGGFLDRFDSLFFSIPFVFVYIYIFI